MRHLLEIDDLTPGELEHLCELAVAPPESLGAPLAGRGVACVFTKPSARTRTCTWLGWAWRVMLVSASCTTR